jgi:hypothetical protein
MNQGPFPCPSYVWCGCYCRKKTQCVKHTWKILHIQTISKRVLTQNHPSPTGSTWQLEGLRCYAGEITNFWRNFPAYTVKAPCRWLHIIFKAAQRFMTEEYPLHILRNVLTNLISHTNKDYEWTNAPTNKRCETF